MLQKRCFDGYSNEALKGMNLETKLLGEGFKVLSVYIWLLDIAKRLLKASEKSLPISSATANKDRNW